uniref:Uncharacterized protein n=1 Tax=Brassica campestris TaxID=3711 RepID=M4D5Z7_BRACM
MFGLHRRNTKEKASRPSASQSSFKSSLNYFDECVSVQEKPNRWSNEHVNTSKGESDPRRRLLQFDVQQFCDNFVKGVDKALKDVSKSQKKNTSTRAPVAEPSFSISKKTQGESENCFEEFKDFSDSSPIFDETDEEPIESLMSCEESCDLPYLESEFINDNEQANVELTVLQPEHPSSLVLSQQVFEEEPLDIPHQCPCLDTWISLDEVPEPIFDVEDEPDPVFDEEATSIISTFMESHLCFDSGTTTAPSSPAPLLHDLQEHCEEPSSLNSLPEMVVNVSTDDVTRFSLDKMKDFCVSKSVFDNMINSLKIFEPDKCLDQSRFQNVNGITSGIILSSDQFLEHNKAHTGRPWLSISTHISTLVLGLSTLTLPVDCSGDFGPCGCLRQHTQDVRGCPCVSVCDRPRSTDQYMEPNQHGDQNVLKISTEVHVFHHTDQTDWTLYWTVPHASGWELWLEPWPDDRFHCTGLCLHRPVFHLMKNSRDGIAFGRTNPELGHCYTFLDSTACTARMSVLELQHYPRPDDGIHQTEAWLYRTVCYSKTNDRARIQNGRTNSSPVHRNSILYSTARTARTTSLKLHQYPCPDDRIH